MTGSTLDGSADHTEYVYDHTNQRVKKHTIVYTPPPGGDPCDPSHEECPVPEQQSIVVPVEPIVETPDPKLPIPIDGSLDDGINQELEVGSKELGVGEVVAQSIKTEAVSDGDEASDLPSDEQRIEVPLITIDPVTPLVEPLATTTPDIIILPDPLATSTPEIIATSTDDIVLPPLDDTEATSTPDRLQIPIELNSIPASEDSATYYIDKYYEKEYSGAARNFYFLGNIKLATDVLNGSNTGIYYDLSDHLGSSSITTDTSGQIIDTTDYYPYGTISYSNTTTNIGDNHKYTGKELDTETNLSYFGARYYNQTAGYFTSIDPYNLNVNKLTKVLSDPQRLHSYLYSRGNPIVLVDPDGNTDVDFGKGLLVGAAVRAYQTGVAITHPIDTAKSIGNLVAEGYKQGSQLSHDIAQNPNQTIGEIRTGLAMQAKEFLAADDYTQGQAVGGAAFDTFLIAEGVSKSSKITTQLDSQGLKFTGERYQLAADPYKGGGGGLILRDLEKPGNLAKQRVISLDRHAFTDGGAKTFHVDADFSMNILGKNIPVNLHHFTLSDLFNKLKGK
ncbi:MAG: RHS repeat-associated core domain-containing protein [Candidatus Komeilibacteria bacterium]